MKRYQTTTFYMETLALIAILILVILILTRVFGMGKEQSQQARALTGAVSLAQDTAEALGVSSSPQDMAELLNIRDNAVYSREAGIVARYDSELRPDPEGTFRVRASWDPEELLSGTLVKSHIDVLYGQKEEPVYSLDTAVFLGSRGN